MNPNPHKFIISSLYFSLKGEGRVHDYKFIMDKIRSLPLNVQSQVLPLVNSLKTQSFNSILDLSFLTTSFTSLFEQLKKGVGATFDSLMNLTTVINDLKKTMPMLHAAVRHLSNFSNVANWTVYMIDVAVFFLCLYHQVPLGLLTLSAIRLAASSTSDTGRAIIDVIVKRAKEFANWVTQSPSPRSTKPFTALVEVAKSFIGLSDLSDQEFNTMFTKLKHQISVFDGVKSVWRFFCALVKSLRDHFGPDPDKDYLPTLLSDVESLFPILNTVQLNDHLGKDPLLAPKIRTLFEKLNSPKVYRAFLAIKQDEPVLYSRYTLALSRITGAMISVPALDASHSQRSTPPIVHFYGPPGVGKSELVQIMAHQLHRALHKIDSVTPVTDAEALYTVNPNVEFRDSYHNQTVYYYDDPNQNMDTTALMPFLLELIQIGQSTPYQLPMADVSLKAGGYFNSPFCFFSTNGPLDDVLNLCSQLQDKGAITRRISYRVKVNQINRTFAISDWELDVTNTKGQKWVMTVPQFLSQLLFDHEKASTEKSGFNELKNKNLNITPFNIFAQKTRRSLVY
jgi:energy-coupling factor transporter ATP-binding protein EcfA2